MADDDWTTALIKELLIDPTGELAKDFILNPWEFAERVRTMEEDAEFAEIRMKVEFQMVVFGNKALYPVSPALIGATDDWASIVVSPHHAKTLQVMRDSGVTVSYVQLASLRRSNKEILWKGQLKNAKVTDDDEWKGYKTYKMEFDDLFVFVDTAKN